MSSLIWIQTVLHSDSVPENVSKKANFDKKSADNNKSMKNYSACKEYDNEITSFLCKISIFSGIF